MDTVDCLIISIEGNIGSGKSTVLQKLREYHPHWVFVDEPVNDWLALKNQKGESLLEVFYKDKQRWSYTFQNAAVLYRFKKLQEALRTLEKGKHHVIVMERCLETDRQIFSKMLWKDGCMDDLEKKLYDEWFTHLRNMSPSVDAYIYVNTNPELSFDRLKLRAREGESIIPLEYLEELANYHKEWLFQKNLKPVLNFDNSQPEISISKISEFVGNLQ
jgi:deoxyadenosine/deoxycytidine kinase